MIANALETHIRGGTLYLYSTYYHLFVYNSVGCHTQTISSNAANCSKSKSAHLD